MAKANTISGLATILLVGCGVSAANAEVIQKREYINRNECYVSKRVPAIVQYNTRGIKVRDASESWLGNMSVGGSQVVKRYNDPVYIQTMEVVEDEHITLVRVKCR